MRLEADQYIMINLNELVPEGHFLRRLADFFPWEKWSVPFEKCFKGEKEYGPSGYPVTVLVKMLVLSYLYNLSDPQTERYVRENNPARYFTGLGLTQRVPDETTLCRFRNRIIEKNKNQMLETLFNNVLEEAQKKGIEMGKVQIIDSVHTESKINIKREVDENKKRKKEGESPRPPKDPDASWGCKGTKKRFNPETGKEEDEKVFFYGYKSHTTMNQKTGLFTSMLFSTGKTHDCNASRFLLESDMSKSISPTVITGDKAYDDLDLYVFCGKHEIFPAIRLKEKRLNQKCKKNCEKWENHTKSLFYKSALSKRWKIEQGYGVGKLHYGLGKCRYTGLMKFAFQGIMTFMSINLRRIVKLLTVNKGVKLAVT